MSKILLITIVNIFITLITKYEFTSEWFTLYFGNHLI